MLCLRAHVEPIYDPQAISIRVRAENIRISSEIRGNAGRVFLFSLFLGFISCSFIYHNPSVETTYLQTALQFERRAAASLDKRSRSNLEEDEEDDDDDDEEEENEEEACRSRDLRVSFWICFEEYRGKERSVDDEEEEEEALLFCLTIILCCPSLTGARLSQSTANGQRYRHYPRNNYN